MNARLRFFGLVQLLGIPILVIASSSSHDRIQETTYLYDTDGRAGAVETMCNPSEMQISLGFGDMGGVTTLFSARNLETPLLQECGISLGVTNESSQGTFYVHHWHPDFGCFTTSGFCGPFMVGPPPQFVFVLPASASKYGITARKVESYGIIREAERGAAIVISEALVADDITKLSVALPMSEMHRQGLLPTATIQLEYLNEDSRPEKQSWRDPFPYGQIIAWRDDGMGGLPGIRIIEQELPLPQGDVRVSICYDGYTTDTIELRLEDHKLHCWKPVVEVTSGKAPRDVLSDRILTPEKVRELLGDCSKLHK